MKRRRRTLANGWRRLGHDQAGAALTELALVLPFLIFLIFGGFEFGRILYQQHLITKGVQDAARYLARTPALNANGTCPPTSAGWGGAVTTAKTIATRGTPTATTELLTNFVPSTVTVDVTCAASTGVTSPNPVSGSVPIVVVSASVPANDIGFFGFVGLTSLTLTAEHREFGVGL